MSRFEYIMVMVSIIQGLGITLALRGISHLIVLCRGEKFILADETNRLKKAMRL